MKKALFIILFCLLTVNVYGAGAFSSADCSIGKFKDALTGTCKSLSFQNDNPQILSQDYLYGIAEGDVSGHTTFTKYGVYTAVTNSATDIWEFGGTYAFPATAVTIEASSSSAADASTSTGVYEIRLECLDISYNTKYVDVSINGTAKVVSASTCFRINKAWATKAGTGGAAAGIIGIRSWDTSANLAQISAGHTQSRQLIYTVPLGKTLYITSVRASCGVGNTTSSGKYNFITLTTRAKVNPQTGAVSTIFYPYSEIGIINQAFMLPLEIPTRIPATADLKISAVGDTALAVNCTATIRGWQE
jgi:hypothetical protein